MDVPHHLPLLTLLHSAGSHVEPETCQPVLSATFLHLSAYTLPMSSCATQQLLDH
jgi:hypothetical protein